MLANFKKNTAFQATKSYNFSTLVTLLEDKLLLFLVMDRLHAQIRQIYPSISDILFIVLQTVEKKLE